MSWAGRDVAWSEPTEHDLRRLQPQIGDRIIQAVERYAMTGRGDVTRLRGQEQQYRLRVGEWRVRFEDDPQHHRLIILRILPRGRAYER